DEINLSLSDQFNVFTGETGAGKSLFVDALNFVSGQRSSASVVGNKGDSSYVEAVFSFKNNEPANALLKELGLYDEEDDVVVFSREMHHNGRSIARINRRVVNLKSIREVLSLVVDIHSQHDTQFLLNEKNHLNLLQDYVHDAALLQDYQDEYHKYQAKLMEIEDLKSSKLDEDELEFSKFILKEIHDLNPSMEDYENLDERLKQLENFESTKQEYQEIENTLTLDTNVLGHLYHLMPIFEKFEKLEEQFKDAYFQLEDISTEISSLNNNFIFDEHEFHELNNRMLNYTQLIRKYGNIDALLKKKEELETSIKNADYFDEVLIDLQNELKAIETTLHKKATKLSSLRKEKALELETSIVKELFDLSLENAVFNIEFKPKEYSLDGIDDVKFMISMNKGMDVSYLSKVASGGELSRVMLGLKVVFSEVQSINTLIFDEIDSGVSGTVAFQIGKKMNAISKTKQVISITHLPAVAACADHHYLIAKEDLDDTTTTHVNLIENDARIEHLAIMMSGNLNEQSLQAAKTLLEEGKRI
ncbi:MAG TPA: DNA repair protein RecN, partial [Erysipelothrix sp.]|nr:DNA repair protein RecN [Erysipelothrix sp.]